MSTRFSPPKDKTDFLKELIDKGSPFKEYRDVLFFAAVVGWRESRRVPLNARGEAIRWDVMNNRYGTEIVMDMMAVTECPDNRDFLSSDFHDERVSILEEYANGGLEVLRERLSSAGAVPIQTVIVRILQEYLEDGVTPQEAQDLTEKVLNL